MLSNRAAVIRYREGGLRDFLVSVQGLGSVYDELVCQQGAHVRQMQALRHLQEVGIPFRFNTVLSRSALGQLVDIAQLAVRTGAEVVNFLGFNPSTTRNGNAVPKMCRATASCASRSTGARPARYRGLEANVRYLPFCVVSERHRHSVYDFPQIPYDLHENDFASWSWTDLPAQRIGNAPLTPPFGLGQRLELRALRTPLRRIAVHMPRVGESMHEIKQRLERKWAAHPSAKSREELYQDDARMRAREYTGYRHVSACANCDAKAVCDGFYCDYVELFGEQEARPIALGGRIADPQHFSKQQPKRIHPDDMRWLADS